MPPVNKEVVKNASGIPPTYPVMNTGIAMPYVALFNFAGLPIFNPITNRPLGASITRFNYKYEVDKNSEANIEIVVGDYQVVDLPDLQEKMRLYIQWGYIYPEGRSFSHRPKAVKIKEVDYTFDDHGTTIKIKALAFSEELDHIPQVINPSINTLAPKQTMVEAMDAGFGHNIGIVIRKFKKPNQDA